MLTRGKYYVYVIVKYNSMCAQLGNWEIHCFFPNLFHKQKKSYYKHYTNIINNEIKQHIQ